MGYTYEVTLSILIQAQAPQVVFDILHYGISLIEPSVQLDKKPELTKELPDHPFFRQDDWEDVFCQVSTLLIPGDSFIRLRKETNEVYSMTLRLVPCAQSPTSLSFVHWVSQYAWSDGYIGMFRDNHNSPIVTLLYREESSTIVIEMTPPVLGVSVDKIDFWKGLLTAEGDFKSAKHS